MTPVLFTSHSDPPHNVTEYEKNVITFATFGKGGFFLLILFRYINRLERKEEVLILFTTNERGKKKKIFELPFFPHL